MCLSVCGEKQNHQFDKNKKLLLCIHQSHLKSVHDIYIVSKKESGLRDDDCFWEHRHRDDDDDDDIKTILPTPTPREKRRRRRIIIDEFIKKIYPLGVC